MYQCLVINTKEFKKMKNKELEKKSGRKGFSVLRSVVLLLAIVCCAVLIIFASQYIKSSKKMTEMKKGVDSQIELTALFYPEYVALAQGENTALQGHIREFEKYLARQNEVQTDIQQSNLNNTTAHWKKLKSLLVQPLPAKKSGVTNDESATYIILPHNIAKIEKIIRELRASLFTLKDSYQARAGVSFIEPLTGIVVLASLAIFLFSLWIILQLSNNAKLQRESDALRLGAENKNRNDQEAIARLTDDIAGLSEGDLTVQAQVNESFTRDVADSINFTIKNMREMVGTIMHTSNEIAAATEDTKNISNWLRKSSEQQSQQMTSATNTATEMAHSLNEIAETTDASVEIAHSSVDLAQEGRSWVMSTVKSMTSARENIQDTSKRIKRLGESSQEIGDIIEIIKSIAEQTNILALNAAIQATAAGEAGRGFAVVADEVQQLAERSGNATKQIEMLVKTIQADANEAVASMENSTAKEVAGAGIAEEAGQSLDKIENVSQNLANLIINVSQATRNAASMANEVAESMNTLLDINNNTVSDVKLSIQSIDDLEGLSISLKESVSGFKLPN